MIEFPHYLFIPFIILAESVFILDLCINAFIQTFVNQYFKPSLLQWFITDSEINPVNGIDVNHHLQVFVDLWPILRHPVQVGEIPAIIPFEYLFYCLVVVLIANSNWY